jgi:hypothetical protein
MPRLLIPYVAVDTDSTTTNICSDPDLKQNRMRAVKYVKEKFQLGEYEVRA